ncbi:MAG: glycogen debranching enzyme GlgX [Ignavibacteria bacterium]|nr:glycogen debranching enzyme GlgX [Ignavibacteria bacterium]
MTKITKNFKLSNGQAHPLGAKPYRHGVNFSLYSENATAVQLLLFDAHDEVTPFEVINLDPVKNMTFHFWHIFVEGLKPGTHYAYRIDGPQNNWEGHRYNKNKILLDPYSKGNNNTLWVRTDACGDADNLATSMRSVVIDATKYDWEGDEPIRRPIKDSVIYEMHVGGFTRNPNSKVKNPGTFKGIIEKIPYLKELGINTIELLPVFEFDEKEILKITGDGTVLKNYWGYSTFSFFAPQSDYCENSKEGEHITEFRDMVKAIHKAGIEVILDVVFNHTNEGNHEGPTINFKGIDNNVYYYLNPDNKEFYYDYSGCGNTVNANHPVVEKFITDCLHYWVDEMHVDGFRFDEGSILSRGEDGAPLKHPPLLWGLELSEIFSDTKLIAEAWDAAGLYQIGSFPGYRWAEWNGKYRDDIRKFLKGDPNTIQSVADRIAGSASIYQHSRHKPTNSINFINCHDGFCLMDLVSYNFKHNDANGEDNRDGIDDNISWNSGAEGYSDNTEIINFRNRRIKNFASVLLTSIGVPMILSGDEVGKSQNGNNNAYCQNNEISWFDWELIEKNKELFRFFKIMIQFRNKNSLLRRDNFFSGAFNGRGLKDIDWHGCNLYSPGWDNFESTVLAFTMGAFEENEPDIHVMMNMDYMPLSFEIPELKGGRKWYRFADTFLGSPNDISEIGNELLLENNEYIVNQYSIVILISK